METGLTKNLYRGAELEYLYDARACSDSDGGRRHRHHRNLLGPRQAMAVYDRMWADTAFGVSKSL